MLVVLKVRIVEVKLKVFFVLFSQKLEHSLHNALYKLFIYLFMHSYLYLRDNYTQNGISWDKQVRNLVYGDARVKPLKRDFRPYISDNIPAQI